LELVRTGLIDAVQVIYNIFDQTPETSLFPLCLKENIGVLARVPLDEGALTGHVGETTTFPPGDFREWYFRGDRKKLVAEHVAALAKDLGEGASLPDTALRFCISNPAVSSVIPGMRDVRHVESNLALADQGPLPAAAMAMLKHHAWDKNFYR
jgi:aryl-alcohol dehydrogenase-like predicted oxidoreductase